eukprot:c25805_g1_i1.p1 GENE.c25805_g1_i1~~c25805_g1_i1.p1  ORF type:complete len:590 (-),score=140.22 c25805_g1_i1:46-1815(-)
MAALQVVVSQTTPFLDQKPGTSGLRKKTRVFIQGNYLANFVQSTFDTLKAQGTSIASQSLLIGGDGRYYNPQAIQTIIKIAVANGVRRIWVGHNGLLSTPACSAIIREKGPVWQRAFGAFILTASHNPGGPEEDFGIKYNCENGGPAPENLTDAIYDRTKKISELISCPNFPTIDIGVVGTTKVEDGGKIAVVEVIDSVTGHVDLLKSVFDFSAIKRLLQRKDFTFVFDSMSGVQGPYAKTVFCDVFGAPPSCLLNAEPKEDFGGGHADPNLTYATALTQVMGVDRKGSPVFGQSSEPPVFGAACDGDADRNMILGRRFFVTPSDSLAIIAAHANVIPFFREQGGIASVARSMPTSGAVDLVAKKQGLNLFEVPTGWKYFGNLMDSKAIFGGKNYTPLICGEESFGTGSDHIREKDGMWAVLAWLSILSHYNQDESKPLVHVEDIVKNHWQEYGRNYYCRYDYEGVDKATAENMFESMTKNTSSNTGRQIGDFAVQTADVFEYTDPVDGSVSKNQGLRFLMADGSRVVFRLSGTAGSGATVRMYVEKYEPATGTLDQTIGDAMAKLVEAGLELSQLEAFTGRKEPTVIT